MKNLVKGIVIVCVAALMMPMSASAVMSLVNGSFEEPVIAQGDNYIEYPVMPGWTVTGSVYYVSFKGSAGGFPPAGGAQELYLFGGTLQQTVGVIEAGKTYTLTFSAGINTGQTAIYSEVVLIDADNGGRLAAINLGDVITGDTAMQWFTGTLIYNSDTYAGSIGHNMAVQVNSGTQLHLDNFAIVPEPATIAVLGIGGLFIRKRRS